MVSKRRNNDNPGVNDETFSEIESNLDKSLRQRFSVEDIRNAPKGKYNWDENGCVFEINEDGSVTVVGTYNISDLQPTSMEQLEDDGLLEMLPSVWAVLTPPSTSGEDWILSYIADELYFTIKATTGSNLLSDIKSTEPIEIKGGSTNYIHRMLNALASECEGTAILMPSNEREYLLSLGAQACIRRLFNNTLNVAIVHPSEMGALCVAISSGSTRRQHISFAYGNGENYVCCNLTAENNFYKTENLLSTSIIRPLDTTYRNEYIARGAFVYLLHKYGHLQGIEMSFIFPYPISFVVRNGNRIVKVYEVFDTREHFPISKRLKSITLNHSDIISVFIGSNEIIDNLITDNEGINSVDISVKISETSSIELLVEATNYCSQIDIGELIG